MLFDFHLDEREEFKQIVLHGTKLFRETPEPVRYLNGKPNPTLTYMDYPTSRSTQDLQECCMSKEV